MVRPFRAFRLACRRNGTTPEQCGCHNGNAGMANLTGYIRSLGFKFGMYSSAGVGACDGAHGTSEGFERQDAELFVRDWQSEYVMVDSCGITPKAPPFGPAPGPGAVDQGRWELTKWYNDFDIISTISHAHTSALEKYVR